MSLFYDTSFTNAYDMELFTDASLVAFGAFFQNQWFCAKWPASIPSVQDDDPFYKRNKVSPSNRQQ